MDEDGAKAIAAALSDNTSLQSLDVPGNDLGVVGTLALVEGVRSIRGPLSQLAMTIVKVRDRESFRLVPWASHSGQEELASAVHDVVVYGDVDVQIEWKSGAVLEGAVHRGQVLVNFLRGGPAWRTEWPVILCPGWSSDKAISLQGGDNGAKACPA